MKNNLFTTNKLYIVAQREYSRTIKSRTFWLATLLLPALFAVIMAVSIFSEETLEKRMSESTQGNLILITDNSGVINQALPFFTPGALEFETDFDTALAKVEKNQAKSLIALESDFLETGKINVFAQDEGLLALGKYSTLATQLIEQSIYSRISDQSLVPLLSMQYKFDETFYRDGEIVNNSIEKFIIPIASVVLYFMFTSLATNFLLMSVSEEKENRMIEIILATIKPKDLIWGKIIGLTGIIMTQLVIYLTFAVVLVNYTASNLPIDISAIQIDPLQLTLAIFYLFAGFIILANTMVGAGSAMPNYRDAQSFSTVFILMSVFPIYAFAFIIADPNGIIALFLSYFPYSAPIVLMLRNALGVLGPLEITASITILLSYVYITGVLAYKLFEYGSLEYNQKISFKNFFNAKK